MDDNRGEEAYRRESEGDDPRPGVGNWRGKAEVVEAVDDEGDGIPHEPQDRGGEWDAVVGADRHGGQHRV
jgi:hypothetical protein